MSNNNHIDHYKDTILSDLPETILTKYIAEGLFIEQTYAEGKIIHLEGDPCTQVEIVIRGKIIIERIGSAGDQMIVKEFYTGDIIGANLIYSSSAEYPLTVTANTSSTILTIHKDILFDLFIKFPPFLLGYLNIFSDQSLHVATKMKNRVSRTIRQSIAIYLLKQQKLQNSNTIKLTMSKKTLAESFGVSRTSLSREFLRMKQEDIIDYDAQTVTILNSSNLTE